MSLNLRNIIKDDAAIKSGGFTGAIFLTYSLNLTFFEQILAPALDQAGCANVLILADPDGYQQALEIGAKTINGAGRRYVCVPVSRKHWGVQHAKLLLMAGKNRGRMLIGSGNLTFHGYGRNLELYSHFEYNVNSDSSVDSYPFIQAWELIQNLTNNNQVSLAAQQQVQTFKESASWLNTSQPTPTDFQVWHNYERPIWEQLLNWRKARGLKFPSLAVKIISPYYDHEQRALKSLARDLKPESIRLHLDPGLTNIDGGKTLNSWGEQVAKLDTFGIGPSEKTDHTRRVHAKAIIGIEENGAWCITGSANLSKPALLSSWKQGGNLELVTFSWENDTQAFDYLLQPPDVQTWRINLEEVVVSESEPSDRTTHHEQRISLADLSARGRLVEGRLTEKSLSTEDLCYLHFQRHNFKIPLRFKDDLCFEGTLPSPLEKADMAKLCAGEFETPFHWVDQPDSLAHYGARTYHARIKGKLETLLGAEKMFQELMNFLWERVDTDNQDEDNNLRLSGTRQVSDRQNSNPLSETPPPPEPSEFITDEALVRTVQWGIEKLQPYDRSLLSLRDLLSIVLLRLTTPTQIATELGDDTPIDDDQEQQRQEEQEAQQIEVLERLRSFLKDYSKRYGTKITDEDFVQSKSPEIIFQNHATLGRVLLELASKAGQNFSQDDFAECLWWIWAPLIWPEIVGLTGASTFQLLEKQFSKDQILKSWNASNLSTLTVVLFSEALGQPPSWESGLWNEGTVKIFMVARELIDKIKNIVGTDIFRLDMNNASDTFEAGSFEGLFLDTATITQVKNLFFKIENYQPPVEEKYANLFELQKLNKEDPNNTKQVQALIQKLGTQELQEACKKDLKQSVPLIPVSFDPVGNLYCRCGSRLTVIAQTKIKRGELVLCDTCRKACLYLTPLLPDTIWVVLNQ